MSDPIPAKQMQVGQTYRFPPAEDTPGGTIRVTELERDGEDLYVSGHWNHDGIESIGETWGAFDPDEKVTPVPLAVPSTRLAPHAYVPNAVPQHRTCDVCGIGANAKIHRHPPMPETP